MAPNTRLNSKHPRRLVPRTAALMVPLWLTACPPAEEMSTTTAATAQTTDGSTDSSATEATDGPQTTDTTDADTCETSIECEQQDGQYCEGVCTPQGWDCVCEGPGVTSDATLTTTEDPTTEDPTTEDPTTEDPTTEDPTTEDPTTEDPTTEDPTDGGDNAEYYAFAAPGGLDRVFIRKADPDTGLCTEIRLVYPGFGMMIGPTPPPGWGVESATVYNALEGCLEMDFLNVPEQQPAHSGTGAIEWNMLDANELYPCELDLDVELMFDQSMQWVPASETMSAQNLPVEGSC